ncbi:hypothetical protein FQA39_LY10630 [Lamprigera yunnana]|nr:hypothetical protein FQA39_LY10630 [Lamprigera yunnana]
MEINKQMLTDFLCMCCGDLMHPPIKVCVLGHCFCVRCDKKSNFCPWCYNDKGRARNFLLEGLYEQFIFPCDFRERGCTFTEKGPVIKGHRQHCAYAIIVCPLELFNCKWVGNLIDVFEHSMQYHPQNTVQLKDVESSLLLHTEVKPSTFSQVIFKVYSQLFYVLELVPFQYHPQNTVQLKDVESSLLLHTEIIPSTFSQVIFKVYSQLFMFTWYVDSTCTTIKWVLLFFGSKEGAKRFNYFFEFFDSVDPEKTIRLEAECELFSDYSENILVKSETFSNKEMLKKMVETKRYHYKLTVRDVEAKMSNAVTNV